MENLKKALNATTAVVFVVAFLLGYGVSSQIMNRDANDASQKDETAQNTSEQFPAELANLSGAAAPEVVVSPPAPASGAPVETTTATVSADDQPAGITATVTVNFDKSMWVAIHEDAKGAPGKILGAQIFPKGARTGAVDLLRPTEGERKYYAMVHTDDGDHTFDPKKDMPAKNAEGMAIMHAFMTIAATPEVMQQ
ncbi:MAG: hypothetical protein HYT41_02545 [Candidatus Sungbacteria bacterium]|nr:hypothetical protein [Candidatus Sungbacteria bacterium]